MKILLTGSNGLFGRNIAEHPRAGEHTMLTPKRAELDLQNKTQVYAYIGDNKPDMVIHVAGKVGGINANMTQMVDFYTINSEIGQNIIMGSLYHKIPRLINMASSCCYPPHYPQPFNADILNQFHGPLEPTNEGYGIAKAAMVRLCHFINNEHKNVKYVSLVPPNLYGRYDKFDDYNAHFVSGIMQKMYCAKMRGETTYKIWGDGTARREAMYAGDAANATFFAIDKFETLPSIINMGLNYDYSMNEYYEKIAKTIGWNVQFDHDLTKPVGMKSKLIDSSPFYDLGFRPQYSLEQGLQLSYEYFLTIANQFCK